MAKRDPDDVPHPGGTSRDDPGGGVLEDKAGTGRHPNKRQRTR
ncbi:hypothetical protein [Nocardioides sp.]